MPSHEHHRIAPTRSTEEGNSADAVNKGAGFMMPDLNGMEFAVREGGKSLSLPLSLEGIYSSSSSACSSPLCPCEISPTANRALRSFRQQEVTTKPEKKRRTRLNTNMQGTKKVFLETRFEWIWIWSRGHSRHYQSMKYIVKTRLYTQRSSVEPNVGRLI